MSSDEAKEMLKQRSASTKQDALDAMLRREFQVVSDDGFTNRVMQALPARRQTPKWVLPAATAVGGVLTWAALAPASLWSLVAREVSNNNLGIASAVLLILLSGFGLLSCAWALDESA